MPNRYCRSWGWLRIYFNPLGRKSVDYGCKTCCVTTYIWFLTCMKTYIVNVQGSWLIIAWKIINPPDTTLMAAQTNVNYFKLPRLHFLYFKKKKNQKIQSFIFYQNFITICILNTLPNRTIIYIYLLCIYLVLYKQSG